MPTRKQVLVQHMAEYHQRALRKAGARPTFELLSALHADDHYRYVRSHSHGPQPNLGPGRRPDGWADGTHVQLKERAR